MSEERPPTALPEPGRLARPIGADTSGWMRWLPGLQTLRGYELGWLPHEVRRQSSEVRAGTS